MSWTIRPIPKLVLAPSRAYSVHVQWRDGRKTIEAQSDNPSDVRGAPMISRNPRAINRIEVHDRTGCLETVWDSTWFGYQTHD